MIIFFKKIIDLFGKLLSKKNKNIVENIELDITWDDIASGSSNSKFGSVLAYSMRRNGMFGYATENRLVLETGEVYSPVQLSKHWKFYINSPKIKPTKLIYFLE